MNNRIKHTGIVLLLSFSLAGCTTDQTGTTYSASEARQMQTVRFGTVAESRLVKLEGTQGEVGTVAGAAVGGIAASSIGGQRESAIAAVAGAVAGGVLGNMAEKKITSKQGVELTVRLDDGSYVSVVQQVDPAVNFAAGDKVKILTQGTASRVVKVQ
ncbi:MULTISPECIES: glycine zipper 2TM domain-containing protein [unclassified Endozoicomonas]|uniref:glycine zipper 2TM domain-containing protein n=1 Tax=unclassified Endozoicomonas TaxID=2644528 RepID=UPI002148AC55|nr:MULTISPECIES: glycine zipper 2TM domain-containing protein [unclassified Endozoicomonas]